MVKEEEEHQKPIKRLREIQCIRIYEDDRIQDLIDKLNYQFGILKKQNDTIIRMLIKIGSLVENK